MKTSVFSAQDVFAGSHHAEAINNLRVLDNYGVAGRDLTFAFKSPRLSELGEERPQSSGAWRGGKVFRQQPCLVPSAPPGEQECSRLGSARPADCKPLTPRCPPADHQHLSRQQAPPSRGAEHSCGLCIACQVHIQPLLDAVHRQYGEAMKAQRHQFQRDLSILVAKLCGKSSNQVSKESAASFCQRAAHVLERDDMLADQLHEVDKMISAFESGEGIAVSTSPAGAPLSPANAASADMLFHLRHQQQQRSLASRGPVVAPKVLQSTSVDSATQTESHQSSPTSSQQAPSERAVSFAHFVVSVPTVENPLSPSEMEHNNKIRNTSAVDASSSSRPLQTDQGDDVHKAASSEALLAGRAASEASSSVSDGGINGRGNDASRVMQRGSVVSKDGISSSKRHSTTSEPNSLHSTQLLAVVKRHERRKRPTQAPPYHHAVQLADRRKGGKSPQYSETPSQTQLTSGALDFLVTSLTAKQQQAATDVASLQQELARRRQLVDQAVGSFSNSLMCFECFHLLDDPVVLATCGHTFCRLCVERNMTAPDGAFQCARCHVVTGQDLVGNALVEDLLNKWAITSAHLRDFNSSGSPAPKKDSQQIAAGSERGLETA